MYYTGFKQLILIKLMIEMALTSYKPRQLEHQAFGQRFRNLIHCPMSRGNSISYIYHMSPSYGIYIDQNIFK